MAYSYNVYQKVDGTWAYDILRDSIPFIVQYHKPAVPGTEGFATEVEATNIASLTKAKLDNELNPAVSVTQVENAATLDVAAEIAAEKGI